MKPLAIIPTYLAEGQDLEVLMTCLESLRKTAGDSCDVLIVDDGSPDPELVEGVKASGVNAGLEFDLFAKSENTGFAKTVNIGLRRALQEGRDAILVNADIEFVDNGWVTRMVEQDAEDGTRLASIVGGLLLYPNGLIQHGGIYFSLLHRCFEHVYKFAPHDLPEAQHARSAPVTGALQFIRHDCLRDVGIYDEKFLLGWEDVDYCIRAWNAGKSVVYQPTIRAVHHESFFRGRQSDKIADWQARSWRHFNEKHANQSFENFVPSLI